MKKARLRAVIFDIDGTLMLTGGAGLRAMEKTLAAFSGSPLPLGFEVAGKTDRAIFAELLEFLTGSPADPAVLFAIEKEYEKELEKELEDHGRECRILPGVESFLDALARADIHLGLGTGNLESGARLKLEVVGLRRRFKFGGYGSDSASRSELIRIAFSRASVAAGEALSPRNVLVVGDTWRDIAAARESNIPVLAVATGPHGRDRLDDADMIVETLASQGIFQNLGHLFRLGE